METTEQQSQKSTQFQFLKVEMKINKKKLVLHRTMNFH